MLLVGLQNIGEQELNKKYADKFNLLTGQPYKYINNNINPDWPINYIEKIKQSDTEYEVTYILYSMEILSCLTALEIPFTLVYTDVKNDITDTFNNVDIDKIILTNTITLEQALSDKFEWIQLPQQSLVVEESENLVLDIPVNKNKLTMEQLLDDDLEITEADVRELKATTNKLKVGMLLQAKNSLNRVLKLSNTLDKLYDELLDRVDNSLQTTDTASLMYTTEYIAKALADTNNFITSLINNDKIQNFFVIDNSKVINIGEDRVDLASREKIRKAVEIVIDNIDYFQEGQYDKMVNPNYIEVEGDNNAGTTT